MLSMVDKRVIEDGAVAMKDGKITFIGKKSHATNIKTETKIDGKGKVTLPGLINCHTHVL